MNEWREEFCQTRRSPSMMNSRHVRSVGVMLVMSDNASDAQHVLSIL